MVRTVPAASSDRPSVPLVGRWNSLLNADGRPWASSIESVDPQRVANLTPWSRRQEGVQLGQRARRFGRIHEDRVEPVDLRATHVALGVVQEYGALGLDAAEQFEGVQEDGRVGLAHPDGRRIDYHLEQL